MKHKSLAKANATALLAEYKGSDGLSDLVLQQRRRARRSLSSARIILFFLLVTVIASLFYYLALPFIEQFLDGRRLTLKENEQALIVSNDAMDIRRGQLQQRLLEVLRDNHDVLQNTNRGIIGDWSEFTVFQGAMPVGDKTLLIWGTDGTLLHYNTAADSVEPIVRNWPATTIFQDAAAIGDDALLIWGDEGTLLRYDIASASVEPLTGNWHDSTVFNGATPAGDNAMLIWGDKGTLLRYDIAAASIEPTTGDWPDFTFFEGAAAAGDNAMLIWGSEGTLLRYDIFTNSVEPLTGNWHDLTVFKGATPAGDNAILIWGSESTLLRYDIFTNSVEPLTGNWHDLTVFNGATPAGDNAILIWGSESTLLRYDIFTNSVEPIADDWPEFTFFNGATPAGDNAMLVWGDEGTLLHYDISTNSVEPITGNWHDLTVFNGATLAGDNALLIWGDEGTLIVHPRPYATLLENGEISSDQNLRSFIDTELVGAARDLPEVNQISQDVSALIGERGPITQQLLEVEEDLDDHWSGKLPLEQQRESFNIFMQICRGLNEAKGQELAVDGFATDPDAVTLACTQAWRDQLAAETGNWWQALAQQVPPGVLLLFLLATLGGLYRYNLRLAGFHHSRADALEMLNMKLANGDIEQLSKLSDALAADKVEFGRANTPADQAVDLAKTVLSRTQ